MASAKRFLSNPPADCMFHPGEILLGYDLVFGQKAAIIKEPPHPDGASQQMKKWRSPLLGCQNLQYRLEARQPDGSSKLLAEGRPVSLKLGEPPAALFDEGESFAELRPSQAGALVADRLGVVYDDWERSMRRQDARYLDGSPSEPQ